MDKQKFKIMRGRGGPFLWVVIVMVVMIGTAYILLSTDTFIDVGDVTELAGNDLSLYDQQKMRKYSQDVIYGLFSESDESTEAEGEETTNDPSVYVEPSATGNILDGEEIDCSGLVGSTVDTISASTPWGAIDTNKQITISGFRWDYMSWAAVKTTTSDQYRLRHHYYPNWSGEVPEAFDSNGFAKIGDRYVVAVTNIDQGGIGRTGQMLDVYLGDGSCIQCVVGDIKAQNSGEYWCTYGHFIGSSTQINVIEFVVSNEFAQRLINPREYIPSLNQGIIKIVRGDVVEY